MKTPTGMRVRRKGEAPSRRKPSRAASVVAARVDRCAADGFYGSVTVRFQAGAITVMEVTETIKPDQLDDDESG